MERLKMKAKTKANTKTSQQKTKNQKIGRWTTLQGTTDIKMLKKGMDFRKPVYRREVFLRFYEFHLRHKAHPGAVYLALPYLSENLKLDTESKLWLAFINGCSQNIVTSYLIFKRFPSLKSLNTTDLERWWKESHYKFKSGSGWDSDRKYCKIGSTGFVESVRAYKKIVSRYGTQKKLFESFIETGEPYKSFSQVWDYVSKRFLSFGRLSTFSYLEFLKIQGLPIDCDNLFLDDMSGSKSHRNGLCKVLGRDDLDWWDTKESTNKNFAGYAPETIEWLKEEGEILLKEAKKRIDHPDVSYFTLESTLCCYKGFHRPNRRYPNVYMDMFCNRIRYAESEWGNKFDIFWEMRKKNLPKHLRLEDNPRDPTNETRSYASLNSEKQNHYRLTGQVIMMDEEWSCFENKFNDKYYR